MAVFTAVSPQQASDILSLFDPAASLIRLEEISAGIENTNYFVTAQLNGKTNDWVLTLFESHSPEDVHLFTDILNGWATLGFPVPTPLRDCAGQQVQSLHRKPALLIPRLPGHHPLQPSLNQCNAMGTLLAQMHTVAGKLPVERAPERDLTWMRVQQERLRSQIPPNTQQLLEREINYYAKHLPLLQRCPQGLIHGDLFRDNVLCVDDRISGLIDFYHSTTDVLLFDLAVLVNDWCKDERGRLDSARLHELITNYQRIRPWSAAETTAWPHLLRLAALRFWLSRLVSRYLPGYQQRSIFGDKTKDPFEMEQLLLYIISIDRIR
jgi:homoserine kinase type II